MPSIEILEEFGTQIRLHALDMVSKGNSSHIACVFSIADILAVLYGAILKKDPKNPNWNERDRFLLSKGHAGAGVYAALALSGYFEETVLATHCKNGSKLSGHISHKGVPGVEFSSGSLGHGLPVACGMAYTGKLEKKEHNVYVVLGDGECNEGSVWEAALFASHHRLDHLYVIVDTNGMQSLKSTNETLDLTPFPDKWKSFGWEVRQVDGHDISALLTAFSPSIDKKPVCIIANTIKGKGVSFMEKNILWHYRPPQGADLEKARFELSKMSTDHEI